MNINEYNYLNNYNEIKHLYENFPKIKKFINENNTTNIMNNIDKFITYFKNDFIIDKAEQTFIISCIFEYDLFKKTIINKMNQKLFKEIIVKKITENLSDISEYSDVIETSVMLCNLKIEDETKINHNYSIIKKIIKTKEIKYNYCFLFDNIKYYKSDIDKIKSYAAFIDVILGDFLSTKTYY